MFRKMLSYGGPLLLAGAALFATPGPGQAQHGGHSGGGHFGGGHFGGGHFGGAHFGGAHLGHPFAHYGYGRFHPYYGSYGYSYPYYGSYGYDTYPYDLSSPMYDSGYSGLYGDVAPYAPGGTPSAELSTGAYQAFYPSSAGVTVPSDTGANLTVEVPADARLWFEGVPTTSTGTIRRFYTPPLAPGRRYDYEVRARWDENGHQVTQTRKVEVTAGAHVDVRFPLPPETAGHAPAVKKG